MSADPIQQRLEEIRARADYVSHLGGVIPPIRQLAREDIPWLLEWVEELRDAVLDSVKLYDSNGNWVLRADGELLRHALARLDAEEK